MENQRYSPSVKKDPILRSMYRKERSTPSSGVRNPNIKTRQDLEDAESLIVDIDSMPNELLEDPRARENIYVFEKREIIDEVLRSLTEREEKVLRMCFGLYDGYESTYEEAAHVLNVGRARIFQIQKKAIQKMKHPTRTKYLSVIVDFENDIDQNQP